MYLLEDIPARPLVNFLILMGIKEFVEREREYEDSGRSGAGLARKASGVMNTIYFKRYLVTPA